MTDSIDMLQDSIRILNEESAILQDSLKTLTFSDQVITFGRGYHLDKWDWFACTIAIISLIVACGMAWWQWQTERNTMKITKEGQIGLLIDYVRHFYANLIVTAALDKMLENKMDFYYPSEEHLRKLAIDLEALHPDAFFRYKEKYNYIHNLLVLFRNYNIELSVAEKHLCSPTVCVEAKQRDLKTLLFKPEHFAEKTIECIDRIAGRDWCGGKKTYTDRLRETIIDMAVSRNQYPEYLSYDKNRTLTPEEARELRARRIEYLKKKGEEFSDYYRNAKSSFAAKLFPGDKSLFFALTNCCIHTEMTAKNSQNSPKLYLIPFDSSASECEE